MAEQTGSRMRIEDAVKNITDDIAKEYMKGQGLEYMPVRGDTVIFPSGSTDRPVYIQSGQEYFAVDTARFVNEVTVRLKGMVDKGMEFTAGAEFNSNFRGGISGKSVAYGKISGNDSYGYDEYPDHEKRGYGSYGDAYEYDNAFRQHEADKVLKAGLEEKLKPVMEAVLRESPYRSKGNEMISVANGKFEMRHSNSRNEHELDMYIRRVTERLEGNSSNRFSDDVRKFIRSAVKEKLETEVGLHPGTVTLENGYNVTLGKYGQYILRDEHNAEIENISNVAGKGKFFDGIELEELYMKKTMVGSKLMAPTFISYDANTNMVSYERFGKQATVSARDFEDVEKVFGRNPEYVHKIQEIHVASSEFGKRFEELKEKVMSAEESPGIAKKLEGAKLFQNALYLKDGSIQIGEFNISRGGLEVKQNGISIGPTSKVFEMMGLTRYMVDKMFDNKFPEIPNAARIKRVMEADFGYRNNDTERVYRVHSVAELEMPDRIFGFRMGGKDYVSHNGNFYEANDEKGKPLLENGELRKDHGRMVQVDSDLFKCNVEIVGKEAKLGREKVEVMSSEIAALNKGLERLNVRLLEARGRLADIAKMDSPSGCDASIRLSSKSIRASQEKIMACRRQKERNNSSLWNRIVSFVTQADAKLDKEIASHYDNIKEQKHNISMKEARMDEFRREDKLSHQAVLTNHDLQEHVESKLGRQPAEAEVLKLMTEYSEKIETLTRRRDQLEGIVSGKEERVKVLAENRQNMAVSVDKFLLPRAEVLAETIKRGRNNSSVILTSVADSLGRMEESAQRVMKNYGELPPHSDKFLDSHPEAVIACAKASNSQFNGVEGSSPNKMLSAMLEQEFEFRAANTGASYEAIMHEYAERNNIKFSELGGVTSAQYGQAMAEYDARHNLGSAYSETRQKDMLDSISTGAGVYFGSPVDIADVTESFLLGSHNIEKAKTEVIRECKQAGKDIFEAFKGGNIADISTAITEKANAFLEKAGSFIKKKDIVSMIKGSFDISRQEQRETAPKELAKIEKKTIEVQNDGPTLDR